MRPSSSVTLAWAPDAAAWRVGAHLRHKHLGGSAALRGRPACVAAWPARCTPSTTTVPPPQPTHAPHPPAICSAQQTQGCSSSPARGAAAGAHQGAVAAALAGAAAAAAAGGWLLLPAAAQAAEAVAQPLVDPAGMYRLFVGLGTVGTALTLVATSRFLLSK